MEFLEFNPPPPPPCFRSVPNKGGLNSKWESHFFSKGKPSFKIWYQTRGVKLKEFHWCAVHCMKITLWDDGRRFLTVVAWFSNHTQCFVTMVLTSPIHFPLPVPRFRPQNTLNTRWRSQFEPLVNVILVINFLNLPSSNRKLQKCLISRS